jgi:hypothetical protein
MKERRDTPGKTFDEFIDCSFVPVELEIERTRTAKLLESGEREFIQPYTTIESWESRKCQAMSGANPSSALRAERPATRTPKPHPNHAAI